MVMPHISPAYRGNPPDYFAPMTEEEPSHMGRTRRWMWSDDPVWNVSICRDCDFDRGIQCDNCEAQRAKHRRSEEE